MADEDLELRQAAPPGVTDSALLALDAMQALLQLGKAEARQWLAAVPELLVIYVHRLPILLLAWISFGVFVACAVFSLTASLVLAAGSFFLLQVAVALLLEHRRRLLLARMAFRETRQGLAALQASLEERFRSEWP